MAVRSAPTTRRRIDTRRSGSIASTAAELLDEHHAHGRAEREQDESALEDAKAAHTDLPSTPAMVMGTRPGTDGAAGLNTGGTATAPASRRSGGRCAGWKTARRARGWSTMYAIAAVTSTATATAWPFVSVTG